ncbi:MAG: ATP-binding protein [Bermanella sp.]
MFGFAICAVVFFQVDSLVRENRQDFIQQEMQGISREFENYIVLRNKILSDYANFPIIVQSVMQPKAHRGSIEDFMNELTLLGDKVPLTLRDYAGDTIYSTNEVKPSPHSLTELPKNNDRPWFEFINSNTEDAHIRLVTPIFYQNIVEGFVQADIALSSVIRSLAFKEHSKQHRIQFMKNGEIVLDLGSQEQAITNFIPLKKLGIKLGFNTNEKILLNSRKSLLIKLVIWLAFIWLIIVLVSYKLGRLFLITPLQRLRRFANDLAEGKEISLQDANNQFKYQFHELAELESHFKTMISKVTRREASLHNAKESLQELNDRLVEHQQQLLHSEKLASVGQLAAGVAHEINNPTGFVMGNIEVLKDYKDDIVSLFDQYKELEQLISQNNTEKINDKIQDIQTFKKKHDMDYMLNDMHDLIKDSLDGTHRIQGIVKDLKNFSRIDSIEKKPVDINEEVIETALRLVSNELKYKCTLKKTLKPIPKYLCNSGELSQVILNLLVNASDAIQDKGEITITSEYMEDYIQIQISDNGSGIKEKDLIRLFDPFFTTKEVGKGTGLGLSISHNIIEKHGGILSVASQVNEGTVFTIMLPIELETSEDSMPFS